MAKHRLERSMLFGSIIPRPKPRRPKTPKGLTGYLPKHLKPIGFSATFGPTGAFRMRGR